MKAKRLAAILLIGTMSISLVACGRGNSLSETEAGADSIDSTDAIGANASTGNVINPGEDPVNTKRSEETLTVGLASEPSTLFGTVGGKTENEEQVILGALLDTLVIYDYSKNEVLPNLATTWDWVDETHLKLALRDDVTMSDGTALVAEDVVYTLNNLCRDLNPANDTGKYLVGATTEDEHTVIVEFTTAAPDFLLMLSWPSFGIVSEDEVNAVGGTTAVQTNPSIGSGRYKFVEWKSGQSVTLERNEEYWNKDYVGYYKTIEFIFTNDAAAREMAVEAGDADVAYDMPVSQAAAYAENEAVNTSIYSFGQEIHLWYNMGDNAGVTKDKKVRAAIDKALDFSAITQVGTAGYGRTALSYWDTSCSFYVANYTEGDRAVDIEGAKKLLEEAGYKDGLEVRIIGLSDISPVLTVMQANLSKAGITLKIETPDTAQFVEEAFGGDYDLICVGDSPYIRTPASVMPFLQKLNIEGPGMVIGGSKWTNEEIDSAIAGLILESDVYKATELASRLDEMIKEETICSNLYSEMKATVYAKDLKGFTIRERGFINVTTLYK